jgi:protein-S-isoprenylcysteine O-methyltransferase Ste14
MKGAYGYIRHPMQCGMILSLTFGSHIFTFEKVILGSVLLVFILIGVKKEEGRLLQKYEQYKDYMNEVKYRFIPYVF